MSNSSYLCKSTSAFHKTERSETSGARASDVAAHAELSLCLFGLWRSHAARDLNVLTDSAAPSTRSRLSSNSFVQNRNSSAVASARCQSSTSMQRLTLQYHTHFSRSLIFVHSRLLHSRSLSPQQRGRVVKIYDLLSENLLPGIDVGARTWSEVILVVCLYSCVYRQLVREFLRLSRSRRRCG